jgi:hypothetical protein
MRDKRLKVAKAWILLLLTGGVTCTTGLQEQQTLSTGAEDKQGKSRYEQSLEEDRESRDDWRVLNHMMYFLAQGKSKYEGVGSTTREFLEQLKDLHLRRDSAKIEAIYSKMFADEDPTWKTDGDSRNAFIHVELRRRLEQVQTWGGFNAWFGLKNGGNSSLSVVLSNLKIGGQAMSSARFKTVSHIWGQWTRALK